MKKYINIILAKTLLKISIAIASGSLLISCSLNDNSQSHTSEIKEGIELNQEPLDAIQQVLELGQDANAFEDDLIKENNYSLISFRELIEYLPQSPRGWTAEKPKGQTTSLGDYSISQVKKIYFQEDKSITVSIFDWAFNSTLYIPFLLSTEFSQESTEGYNKGIKIDNIPGRENYDYYSKNGSLNLLINRRFFVKIEGDNIEERELREWWGLLDHESLSKLK